MSETVFTFSGKAGDAIHQYPVAYHWHKKTGEKFTCWMDERSTKMLYTLFAAQPCVEKVEFKPGIENYNCGGQPFHFNLPSKEYTDRRVFHLGLRAFPQRQLTLECLATAKVPVEVDPDTIAKTCAFDLPDPMPKANRLVLHGQGVCPHSKQTPQFWKFLAGIREELPGLFDEIVFVGSVQDRGVGRETYPEWGEFDDDGDFLLLARLLASSRCVIGCGSSVVALAGGLKVPCIRVHDPIGNHPRKIWDNLGENQLNDTEIGLRKSWPEFRDKWLMPKPW